MQTSKPHEKTTNSPKQYFFRVTPRHFVGIIATLQILLCLEIYLCSTTIASIIFLTERNFVAVQII